MGNLVQRFEEAERARKNVLAGLEHSAFFVQLVKHVHSGAEPELLEEADWHLAYPRSAIKIVVNDDRQRPPVLWTPHPGTVGSEPAVQFGVDFRYDDPPRHICVWDKRDFNVPLRLVEDCDMIQFEAWAHAHVDAVVGAKKAKFVLGAVEAFHGLSPADRQEVFDRTCRVLDNRAKK